MDQRQEQTQQMTLSASQQYQLHVLEQPAAELEEEWRRLKRRLHRHYPNQVSLEVEQMAGHLASYEDELLAQIRLESVRQEIGYMAEQLIVYLEADGLLRTSDEQLAASFSTDVATITEARTLLQQCEPVGIAARSERECQWLQAIELDDAELIGLTDRLRHEPASQVFAQFSEQDRARLRKRLTRLSRTPDLPREERSVMAEARIHLLDAKLQIDWMTLDTDQTWLGLKEATPFLRAYERRRVTMHAILSVLLERQERWFKGELHLEPLTKKQVAEATGHHPSTIGRAIAEKYVETVHGLVALEDLFVSRTTSGDSSFLIKRRIAEYIQHSDRPLSDQQLTDRLQADGLTVARRTVAKYRAALGLTKKTMQQRKAQSEWD